MKVVKGFMFLTILDTAHATSCCYSCLRHLVLERMSTTMKLQKDFVVMMAEVTLNLAAFCLITSMKSLQINILATVIASLALSRSA